MVKNMLVGICTMGQGGRHTTCIGLKMAKLFGVLASNTGSITEAVKSACVCVCVGAMCADH